MIEVVAVKRLGDRDARQRRRLIALGLSNWRVVEPVGLPLRRRYRGQLTTRVVVIVNRRLVREDRYLRQRRVVIHIRGRLVERILNGCHVAVRVVADIDPTLALTLNTLNPGFRQAVLPVLDREGQNAWQLELRWPAGRIQPNRRHSPFGRIEYDVRRTLVRSVVTPRPGLAVDRRRLLQRHRRAGEITTTEGQAIAGLRHSSLQTTRKRRRGRAYILGSLAEPPVVRQCGFHHDTRRQRHLFGLGTRDLRGHDQARRVGLRGLRVLRRLVFHDRLRRSTHPRLYVRGRLFVGHVAVDTDRTSRGIRKRRELSIRTKAQLRNLIGVVLELVHQRTGRIAQVRLVSCSVRHLGRVAVGAEVHRRLQSRRTDDRGLRC